MRVDVAGLRDYMQQRNLDIVVVDVVDVNVPKLNWQKAKTLAKRLVITGINTNAAGGSIKYAMYNSFKESSSYLPPNFEFDILPAEIQEGIITEYNGYKSGLEDAFREAFEENNPLIQAKLNEALAAIDEAKKIANDSGIPFKFNPNDGVESTYTPPSMRQKFGTLLKESEVIADLTEVYDEGYDGWNGAWNSSSANC